MCLKAVGKENIPYNQKSDKSQQDSRTQENKIKNEDIQQSRKSSQENEKKSRTNIFKIPPYNLLGAAKFQNKFPVTNIFKIPPYNLLGAAKFQNKFLSNQNIQKISKPNKRIHSRLI